MNEIQIFNNPEFGDVRTIIIGGKEYFYGVDVAAALLYKRPSKAVADNCKGILDQDTIKNAGGYPELLIPEGDVYRLIIKAGQQGNNKEIKEKADKFEKWIFDDVLPSIRKTGGYGQQRFPMTIPEQIQLLAQGNVEVNKRIDTIEERFNQFEQSLPLLPNEADEVSNAVKKRVVEVLGGKTAPAYKDRKICQRVFIDAYRELKRNFNVGRYKDIKREQKAQAVEVAGRYEPPLYLKEQIEQANAQMKLNLAEQEDRNE